MGGNAYSLSTIFKVDIRAYNYNKTQRSEVGKTLFGDTIDSFGYRQWPTSILSIIR